MDDIAVLIPCYNEDKTIEKVVSDFKRVLPDAIIYVYDNNSTDDTEKLAKKAGAVVRHEYQQGKGNVVRRMFQEIDAHCYILVDGDDTYPAESCMQTAAVQPRTICRTLPSRAPVSGSKHFRWRAASRHRFSLLSYRKSTGGYRSAFRFVLSFA